MNSSILVFAASGFLGICFAVPADQAQEPIMDNKIVIEMKEKGASLDLILEAIQSAPQAHFRFSTDDFEAFSKAKLGPVILKSMFDRSREAAHPHAIKPRATADAGDASLLKQRLVNPVSDVQAPKHRLATSASDTPAPKPRPSANLLPSAPHKTVKIHGYVTELHSQTAFEVDDYRIMRDQSLTINFENEGGDSEDLPNDIRVGTEVEIKGDFEPISRKLLARSIRIFPPDLRKLRPRTALVENMPELTKSGENWKGSFRVDGQLLLVDETSEVRIVPNSTQKKRIKGAERARKAAAKDGKDDVEAETETAIVKRLDDIQRNMFVSYSGRRLKNGQVQATRLVFQDNELTKGEIRLWKSLKPKIKNFSTGSPGEIRVAGRKLKTIPDAALQKYIQDLGHQLIPNSQRDLLDGSEDKIPFQFYLVQSAEPNAFATANGVVCVNSSLLNAVENEAQLAFVLGHEIAHATQEHTRRQMEFHRKKRFALAIGAAVAQAYGAYNVSDILKLTEAAIANGYSRYLEDQADRLGMEYMIHAGFDPREAPRAWKSLALKMGDRPTNFFWSNHDNHTTRRSYLMAELRANYSEVDFSTKLKDSDRFESSRKRLQEDNSSKKRTKQKG